MIITDTTIVGYAVINGSWSIQMGLFIGSLVNLLMFKKDDLIIAPSPLIIHGNLLDIVQRCRVELVFVHAFLVISNFIMHAPRFTQQVLKYVMTFLGMLMYTYEILSLGLNNYLTPSPDDPSLNVATSAVVTWFRVEIFAWVGILFSNILFMAFRTQIKPTLDSTIYVDEKKKLPTKSTRVNIGALYS